MEHTREDNVVNDIKEARKIFNDVRRNLPHKETKRIRYKLHKKETVYNFLKEKEQKGSLTRIEKRALKNLGRYPKNIVKHLKNFRKYLKKSQKYQYGLDYLFNQRNEEDCITEPTRQDNISNAIKEARQPFNDVKSNLSRKETKRIRDKIRKKETAYNSLKEKEQKGSLTNREKNMLKNISRYLNNFKKDLEKLQKYSITYGLDYLFDETPKEEYYKPTEIKSAFDSD